LVRKRKKKPRPKRAALWLFFIFLVGASALIWWLWPHLFPPSPQFNFLLIEKDGQALKLLKGEVLHINPRDRFRIKKISSNRFLSQGFRLYAAEFDINAFLHAEPIVSDFLPQGDIFNRHDISVEVKYRSRTLGHVTLRVEPDLEDWLAKADRTIDKGRKIALLEKALTFTPDDDVRLKKKLIDAYKSHGQWPQAAAMLEKMAGKTPDEKILNDLLGVYEAMPDQKGIVSVMRRLIKRNPKDAELKIRLANVLEESGKLAEAGLAYEAALKDMGKEKSAPLYKTLGYLYTRTDQPQKAVSSYLKALELDPSDANLYYNLANLYKKSGQQRKADVYLAKALSLKSEDMEGRLSLSERLIKTGKLTQAEAYLNDVLKKNPDSREALILLLAIAEKRRDKGALLSLYKKIHALDPKNDTVIYNLGALEYEAGRLKKSIPYFKKYLAIHPKDKESHAFLFDIYKRLKQKKAALYEAQALISLDPKDKTPYYYMIESLNESGDYKKLIDITQKGLKSHPGDMDLREYLVLAYLKTGKETRAFQEIQKILKTRPKDVPLLLQAATLQEKKGDSQDALKTYQRILEISPGHQEAKAAYIRLLLQRADDLEEQEKLNEALDIYKKILEISPGQEEAEESYLRLRLEVLPGEAENQ